MFAYNCNGAPIIQGGYRGDPYHSGFDIDNDYEGSKQYSVDYMKRDMVAPCQDCLQFFKDYYHVCDLAKFEDARFG